MINNDSITVVLDRLDRRFTLLENKAKRINYTVPVEPDRSTLNAQTFVNELKKSARISHAHKS